MAERSLRLSVILSAIDKATGPFRRVMGGSTALGKSIRATSAQLKTLNQQQAQLNGFRELKNKTDASSTAMRAAQQTVAGLRREIQSVGVPTEKMVAALAKAEKTSARLKTRHMENLRSLTDSRKALEAAGIGTRDFATHEKRLRSEIEATTQAMRAQQARLGAMQKARERAAALQRAGTSATLQGAGLLYAGQRVVRGAVAPAAAAISFESSMADVRKVVDFKTPEQFAKMGRDIQDLSMRLPMTADEIAKIVAAAGQAGVARNELLQFATDATKMGVAFDSTAEEAGQTMATWRTAFRMGQKDVVVLADKINYLGNTGPASVQKITDVVTRIGALGEVAGLQSGALAALGATVAGMGIESEVSATGIKNLLLSLSAGAAATPRQSKALKALGLDAVQLARAMQQDAGPAIVSVLQKLQQLPKAEQAATMTQLFGRESIGAIAPLLTNLKLLQENFDKVGNASRYGASMEAEYQARVATSANALQLAKNTALVLAQAIGTTLIPDIKTLAAQVSGVTARVIAWIREHPRLTRSIALVAIGGAALVTVLGGLLFAGGLAAIGLAKIQGAVSVLTGGRGLGLLMTGLRAIPGLLTAISVPAWPVIAVIALIAAAALLIWKYWQPIKAFMIGFWEGLRSAAAPVLVELKSALAPLAPLWDMLAQAMGVVWRWIQDLFSPFQATTAQLRGATEAGRTFGQMLGVQLAMQIRMLVKVIGWMVSAFMAAQVTIQRVFGGIVSYVQGAWRVITGIFSGDSGRIRAGLVQMWAGINAVLAGWPAKMTQAGVDMLTGFVQGIRSMIGTVTSTIAGVGSGVIGRFKSLLGIRSPSRVFAQLGDYSMQGLAGGLDRSGGLPLQAMQRIAGSLRSVGAGMALGAAAMPAAAVDTSGPARPARGLSLSVGGDTYQITIQAAPGSDARGIAQQIRAEIEQLQREKAARLRSALSDYGD